MLISFSVANFLSFKDKQTLDMFANKVRKHSERIYSTRYVRLTKAKLIMGPNASGKTNMVNALKFMKMVICRMIPKRSTQCYFRQDATYRDKPSLFEISFILNGKRYTYGFEISLYNSTIENEWLYELYGVDNNKKYIFKRSTNSSTFVLGEFFKDKETITKLSFYGEDTASDSDKLFLNLINQGKSKLIQEKPEASILADIFNWFKNKLIIRTNNNPDFISGSIYPFKDVDKVSRILKALGIGVTAIKKETIAEENLKQVLPKEIFTDIMEHLEKEQLKVLKEDIDKIETIIKFQKSFYEFTANKDEKYTAKTIKFCHENKDVSFALHEESDGTMKLLDIIDIFFNPNDDNVYIFDEIDRCLHPYLTSSLFKFFLKIANNRNCQLISSIHETHILADDLLRTDELCFLLKDNSGVSKIHSLDEYNLRNDKKVYTALFDKTITAMPEISDADIENIYNDLN